MRKTVFLTLFLILFLSLTPVKTWASPADESPSSPWVPSSHQPSGLNPPKPGTMEGNHPKVMSSNSAVKQSGLKSHPLSASSIKTTYSGVVLSILPGSRAFILNTNRGAKTIQANGQTTFQNPSVGHINSSSFDKLKIGDHVMSVGEIDGTGLMTARLVMIFPPNKEVKNKKTTVDAIVNQKIISGAETILTANTVNKNKLIYLVLNKDTVITGKNHNNISINDLQVGNRVIAVGIFDDKNNLVAKRLHIVPGLAGNNVKSRPADMISPAMLNKNRQMTPLKISPPSSFSANP